MKSKSLQLRKRLDLRVMSARSEDPCICPERKVPAHVRLHQNCGRGPSNDFLTPGTNGTARTQTAPPHGPDIPTALVKDFLVKMKVMRNVKSYALSVEP